MRFGKLPEEMEPDWRESIGKKAPIMVPVERSAHKIRIIMACWGVLTDPPTNLRPGNARPDNLGGLALSTGIAVFRPGCN